MISVFLRRQAAKSMERTFHTLVTLAIRRRDGAGRNCSGRGWNFHHSEVAWERQTQRWTIRFEARQLDPRESLEKQEWRMITGLSLAG
jgi:hypothetical protein